MIATVTEILLLLLIAAFVHFIVLNCGKRRRMLNAIPGPMSIPIVGNVHLLQGSLVHIWNVLRKLGSQYYPIYRIWTFHKSAVNILNPDDMETILGNPKSTQKSELYGLLEPWFGTGLLTSNGQKWQLRRKILTPAFHFNVLRQFVDIFIEESERTIQTLKSEGGPVVKDLLPIFIEHTLNVMCETSMGTSLKDKGPFQAKYRKAVHDMGRLVTHRTVSPWLHDDRLFSLFPSGRQQFKLLKVLHGFTNQIIKERKQYHDETNGRYLSTFDSNTTEQSEDINIGTRRKRLAMLDLLIAAQRNNQIDDEGIREEVDTFMFRGHDTTAMCLCMTVMLLAEHKDVQERARKEVNTVMEQHEGKLTMTALQNLSYLDRCIKESLRLYPSVPFISRTPETEVRLSNYTLPDNTLINLHIIDMHRNPQYWPNPYVYDPDRFLPENIQGRHPYSYIPFSAGPRNCIGQRFAMLEVKTTIGLLLHNFYLEPVDYLKDISIAADLVLRPSHSIRTKFIPIETVHS